MGYENTMYLCNGWIDIIEHEGGVNCLGSCSLCSNPPHRHVEIFIRRFIRGCVPSTPRYPFTGFGCLSPLESMFHARKSTIYGDADQETAAGGRDGGGSDWCIEDRHSSTNKFKVIVTGLFLPLWELAWVHEPPS